MLILASFHSVHSKIWNILYEGVIPDDDSRKVYDANQQKINKLFTKLQPGDIFYVPANFIFWTNGGLEANNLSNVTFKIDGTISYQDNQRTWPRQGPEADAKVKHCLQFNNVNNLVITSNYDGKNEEYGTFNGNGKAWWGYISYLRISENRPRLLQVEGGNNILIENILFKDSPYWTTMFSDVDGVEIRYSKIDVRYFENSDIHDLKEIRAFNTDGFNFAGRNIWVHHCKIFNEDDCFTVKQRTGADRIPCSENMLFEDSVVSGVGLTIGSIGPSVDHTCVRNITFRNIEMPNTFKGVYIKSRPGTGTSEISNILYENIRITNPNNWAIWIGPQQAIYDNSCAIVWPFLNPKNGKGCYSPPEMTFSNITLKNVEIIDPKWSPGVIQGATEGRDGNMDNIHFDNVIVRNPPANPWGDKFYGDCVGVNSGWYSGNTWPVPPCFKPVETCQEFQCARGYFCAEGKCETCPKNAYCPVGSTEPIPCPNNGITFEDQQISVTACYNEPETQIFDFAQQGGLEAKSDYETFTHNTRLFNEILKRATPGSTIKFPKNKTFYFKGGIYGENLSNVTFIFDGRIKFQDGQQYWPEEIERERVQPAIYFLNFTDVIFTSTVSETDQKWVENGIIDGNGKKWWGIASYLKNDVLGRRQRPKLFNIYESENILFENILLKDSPNFNFKCGDCKNLEVRNSKIDCRFNPEHDTHGLREITAFNTDGFDVSGRDIWIHDVEVFNEDDSVCIKYQNQGKKSRCTENVLVENVIASGVGLSIGSLYPKPDGSCIRNITFRNAYMPKTFKGIYLKTMPGEAGETGLISDIRYENITITEPNNWPIWIGPQQAFGPVFDNACPLVWPFRNSDPEICYSTDLVLIENVTLKDVTVIDSKYAPGVLKGGKGNPYKNIVFDNVVFENPGDTGSTRIYVRVFRYIREIYWKIYMVGWSI